MFWTVFSYDNIRRIRCAHCLEIALHTSRNCPCQKRSHLLEILLPCYGVKEVWHLRGQVPTLLFRHIFKSLAIPGIWRMIFPVRRFSFAVCNDPPFQPRILVLFWVSRSPWQKDQHGHWLKINLVYYTAFIRLLYIISGLQ